MGDYEVELVGIKIYPAQYSDKSSYLYIVRLFADICNNCHYHYSSYNSHMR